MDYNELRKAIKELYIKGQKESGIKEGDKVKIVCQAMSLENGWESHWSGLMDKTIGLNGNVVNMDGYGVHVSVNGEEFSYPYWVLEIVEDKPKYKFNTFEQVLVKRSKDEAWIPKLYGRYTLTSHQMLDGTQYNICIPYKGNERLAFTNREPE